MTVQLSSSSSGSDCFHASMHTRIHSSRNAYIHESMHGSIHHATPGKWRTRRVTRRIPWFASKCHVIFQPTFVPTHLSVLFIHFALLLCRISFIHSFLPSFLHSSVPPSIHLDFTLIRALSVCTCSVANLKWMEKMNSDLLNSDPDQDKHEPQMKSKRIDGMKIECMNEWINGWMDGWKHGWSDGWMGGWIATEGITNWISILPALSRNMHCF